MIIREANPGDAAAIAALADQLGYAVSPAEVVERLPRVTCVVADDGGRVIGMMQVERRHLITAGPTAEVTALVVDAAARGRGVGIALLDWAESWAAEGGCDVVRIRCNTVRAETHRFYANRGYREVKTQKLFEKGSRT